MSERTYIAVAEALRKAGSNCGAAEAHGGLCGSLCAAGPEAGQRWLGECVPELAERLPVELEGWCDDTWRRLSGGELDFELVVPDDGDPLEERVGELATWCHGFLVGLGSAGLDIETDIESEQLKEIVADFIELSRADASAEADLSDADFELAELIEYVRVSVQLAFEELAPRRSQPPPTVH